MKGYKLFLMSIIITICLVIPNGSLSTTTNAVGSGSVFLGGGSLQDDNSEVWNALYNAAGGGTPKIAVFCSAAPSLADAQDSYYNDTPDYLSWENLFISYGFDPVFIPIAIDNYQTAAYDQTNIDLVNSVDAVWFNGGDQSRHARALLKDDGSDTPLMTAVRNVYQNGGLIGGSSAGAAIQGSLTYGEGISHGYMRANGMIEKAISDISLADPNDYDNGGYTTGFGFVSDIDACVDTHVGGRGRIGRMIVAMRELNNDIAIGVDENSAIVISNGVGEVYGQYGALILDGSNATYPSGTYFSATGIESYSLSSGDTIDFSTMEVTSTKDLITNPYYSSAYNSRDVFTTDEAFKVMEDLVDSDENFATGKSKEGKTEFILTFTKNSSTEGYYKDSKYTVDNLTLDVSN